LQNGVLFFLCILEYAGNTHAPFPPLHFAAGRIFLTDFFGAYLCNAWRANMLDMGGLQRLRSEATAAKERCNRKEKNKKSKKMIKVFRKHEVQSYQLRTSKEIKTKVHHTSGKYSKNFGVKK
jgi:hypothetical protein